MIFFHRFKLMFEADFGSILNIVGVNGLVYIFCFGLNGTVNKLFVNELDFVR